MPLCVIACLSCGSSSCALTGVALAIGSVALLADSVDFLEDTAVNVLIALALGLPLAKRATAGKVMAVIMKCHRHMRKRAPRVLTHITIDDRAVKRFSLDWWTVA